MSSALIIGLIFGLFVEITVFMITYIPLRSFAGGYHAKTAARCYIISIMIIVAVSFIIKYVLLSDGTYYVLLGISVIIIFIFSPVEAINKPLDKTEHKIYKRRALLFAGLEIIISIILKYMILNKIFIAILYSLIVVSIMLIMGKVKICIQK